MYRISKTEYGFEFTLLGFIEEGEMRSIKRETEILLAGRERKFAVLVDMTMIKSLPIESRKIMIEMQKKMVRCGMSRSALILENRIISMQFKKLARESGIDSRELHINASKCPNWKKTAMAWILNGEREEERL